ncbi:MAG TPA: cytochrome C assembly protein, partial [Caldimonas sp.]|nr:cytochrome C assembly protein [Caldimonas sp.]
MILSFGPETSAAAPLATALAVPSVLALACYVAAAIPGERFSSALRTALLVGWIMHGVALVIDVTGIGTDRPGARFGFAPALSVTLWFVLAVYEFESRFVPLVGARRALATLGAIVVVLAWLFPGQVHPQAASVWAPLHWLL